MNKVENQFFDDLDAHLKALESDPNPINQKSAYIIYCLMKLAAASLKK
jgi:hypothetical protein